MTEQKHWGIVGGGILGMTLALRLNQAGHKVSIIESADKPGGLTSSWDMNGIVWDRFYHVILMSDLNTRRILNELGLEEKINWVETKTGFFSGGKLYSMSNILEFLQFPPISLIGKFRLGLTILVASRLKNWQRLEKIPVTDWLIRWSGKNVFENIWLPLLKAKLGENYKETSAAFIWSTIQRMYAARKSGLKKEMFGYVSGGYEVINRRFADHLIKNGIEFHLNTQVEQIKPETDGRITLLTGNGNTIQFDRVISTLSSRQSVMIADCMNEEEKSRHLNVKYLGVVCPSILLKRAISRYYVTNITEKDTPFTGIIEMTALIDREKELQGKHLVYLPKYVNPDDEAFSKEDQEVKNIFTDALFRMYPDLSENDIDFFGVAKARIVFALPTLNYSVNLPGIRTSIPNFYIINSAQIIHGTLNVNETIDVAESKLKIILNE